MIPMVKQNILWNTVARAIYNFYSPHKGRFMSFNVASEFSTGDPLVRQGKLFGYGKNHGISWIPQGCKNVMVQ
jgi:hypothetical protein